MFDIVLGTGSRQPEPDREAPLYFGNRKIDELLEELDRNDRDINSGQLTRLRLIADLDREDVWDDNGYRDMTHWVSAHYKMGYYKAGRVLGAARAIDNLPLIAHAYEDGRISEDQLIELCRFATPETEEDLLGWTLKVSLGSLKHKADVACRPEPEETKRIDKERSVRWWWEDGGSRFGLAAYLPTEEGAKVAAALDELAAKIPTLPTDVEDDFGDLTRDDTLEARRADALVLALSEASGDGASLPTVVLHAELDALLGDGGCELEGGGIVHPDVALRLLCDSKLRTVLSDGNNGVIGIGRADREVPTWLREQLVYRDGGCTFPGCGLKRYTQAHHIWPWAFGGPTNLDNLVLVCGFHHKLVHEHHWTVHLVGERTEWRRPGGELFQSGPAPPPSKDLWVPDPFDADEDRLLLPA